jgi:putative endonuclease
MRQPAVYILTNKPNGTLYVGVTSKLVRRIWEHRNHFVQGFTYQYNLDCLVWYESHESIVSAISREKQIKNWLRAWKIEMIENDNPEWRDLYFEIC